jgi:hypothetical protein
LLANPNDCHFNAGEGTFIFSLGEEFAEHKVAKKNYLIPYRMAIAAFNKKKAHFMNKLDLKCMKKLVQCYILNTALYGANTWTLQKVDRKYLGSSEIWCQKGV